MEINRPRWIKAKAWSQPVPFLLLSPLQEHQLRLLLLITPHPDLTPPHPVSGHLTDAHQRPSNQNVLSPISFFGLMLIPDGYLLPLWPQTRI